MPTKFWKTAAAVLLVASAAPAQEKKKPAPNAPKPNQLEGTLAAVDAARNEIRVVSGSKDPKTGMKSEADTTLAVKADAKIVLAGSGKEKGGTAVKLTDLKAGMRVVVVLSEDKKTATELRAAVKENAAQGSIRAADADKKTITLTTKTKGGEKSGETYAVAADATVKFAGHGKTDGKDGRLADLREGMGVTLRLSEDGKTVLSVMVAAPAARGVVKEVDAARGSITVTAGAKDAAKDTTYTVGKAEVRMNGQEAKLTDLKPGTQVEVLLAPGDGGVVGVRAGEKTKVK